MAKEPGDYYLIFDLRVNALHTLDAGTQIRVYKTSKGDGTFKNTFTHKGINYDIDPDIFVTEAEYFAMLKSARHMSKTGIGGRRRSKHRRSKRRGTKRTRRHK